MKPRRKKERQREMNKNNPFSGGNSVCVTKPSAQYKKKGLGQLLENTRRGLR